jgi:hypothetical protein
MTRLRVRLERRLGVAGAVLTIDNIRFPLTEHGVTTPPSSA